MSKLNLGDLIGVRGHQQGLERQAVTPIALARARAGERILRALVCSCEDTQGRLLLFGFVRDLPSNLPPA